MANITGTNGDDSLVGTAHADRLAPLLGYDWVDGGNGQDILVVDYRSAGTGYSYASASSIGGTLSGYVQSGDGQNSVSFQNVERLELKLDGGDGIFGLEGSALALGASVDVDAGAGIDTLQADLTALGALTLEIGSNGKLKVGGSSFSNFENYYLTLGGGSDQVKLGAGDDLVIAGGGNDVLDGSSGNDALYGDAGRNVLIGGAGDDSLISTGIDTVDGGDGHDYWQGDYGVAADNLIFSYDGSLASVSNGTVVTNVENVFIVSGSGDDVFKISGGARSPEGGASVILYSGAGYDTLTVDLANGQAGTDFISVNSESSSFSGAANGVSYSDFEEVSFTGDAGDTARFALYSFDSGIEAIVQPDGTLTTNLGVTLHGYSAFRIQLGEGNDVVVTGAGRDTIDGMGGDDIITGGLGGDNLFGGEGADVFIYNSAEDSGFGTGRTDGILDFSSDEGDKIDLQNVIDGEFTFVGGDSFSGSGVAELRTQDTGIHGEIWVQGDADGDGVIDFQFVVIPSGTLSASDFLL